MVQMQARSPEESKALEEQYAALEEAGSHFDEVVGRTARLQFSPETERAWKETLAVGISLHARPLLSPEASLTV